VLNYILRKREFHETLAESAVGEQSGAALSNGPINKALLKREKHVRHEACFKPANTGGALSPLKKIYVIHG
jgi:hypothetical protein